MDVGDVVAPRSMSLVLHPDLADHMKAQPIRLPKKTLLYGFRLNIDFASMLWAREHLFNSDAEFRTHLRLDSSPQFNRNYLVGECDRISLAHVSSSDLNMVFLSLLLVLFFVMVWSPAVPSQ